MKVFVYGTLRKGQYNHSRLDFAKLIEEIDYINGEMYNYGSFPAITLESDNRVIGEVYEVDENILRSLDSLEGYPSFYDRKDVVTEKGHKVFVYFMEQEKVERLDKIGSGDWLKR